MREECVDQHNQIWQEKVISRLFYAVKIKDHVKPSDFEEEVENFINEQKSQGKQITGLLLKF